jgi:hypothetical protein
VRVPAFGGRDDTQGWPREIAGPDASIAPVLNPGAAKRLGLKVPNTVLEFVDEVIE